ncbi:hypothetical protein JCM10449v2_007806 [Rhodotorula kratochvilovae]
MLTCAPRLVDLNDLDLDPDLDLDLDLDSLSLTSSLDDDLDDGDGALGAVRVGAAAELGDGASCGCGRGIADFAIFDLEPGRARASPAGASGSAGAAGAGGAAAHGRAGWTTGRRRGRRSAIFSCGTVTNRLFRHLNDFSLLPLPRIPPHHRLQAIPRRFRGAARLMRLVDALAAARGGDAHSMRPVGDAAGVGARGGEFATWRARSAFASLSSSPYPTDSALLARTLGVLGARVTVESLSLDGLIRRECARSRAASGETGDALARLIALVPPEVEGVTRSISDGAGDAATGAGDGECGRWRSAEIVVKLSTSASSTSSKAELGGDDTRAARMAPAGVVVAACTASSSSMLNFPPSSHARRARCSTSHRLAPSPSTAQRYHTGLTRRQASLLARLRLDCAPLNAHLARTRPLHRALTAFPLLAPDLNAETLLPDPVAPWAPDPTPDVRIDETKEKALEAHLAEIAALPSESLLVYSDGSLLSGRAGAGVVSRMVLDGEEEGDELLWAALRHQLGVLQTVYVAELEGLRVALATLAESPPPTQPAHHHPHRHRQPGGAAPARLARAHLRAAAPPRDPSPPPQA